MIASWCSKTPPDWSRNIACAEFIGGTPVSFPRPKKCPETQMPSMSCSSAKDEKYPAGPRWCVFLTVATPMPNSAAFSMACRMAFPAVN